MILNAFLGILAARLASGVWGGQIPVVDGVYGGVSSRITPSIENTVQVAATTPGKLRVKENSGVCETTKGVYQASGYGDLTSSQSIWYATVSKLGIVYLSLMCLGSGSLLLGRIQTQHHWCCGLTEGQLHELHRMHS
jgi:hypothetical protein